ncbi:relaxase/mobilization nuclease domain-containing protein [Ruminococcus flavefaciens]|uniref:relaxase/mobilization nuclease domain-containing protein n=1 Tax=Ruminococcus flavefaciens TaxID=1265 RepID=UPI0002E6C992|nr:relaxase/mobilization nuclease domain-containing protein [Ruminococcus flavefaciens]
MNTIIKDIYFTTKKFEDVLEMHSYLSDRVKTETDKNISGLGFISDNYMDEIYTTKVANQNTHTTQTRQITISISPINNSCSDDEYIKMGLEMAKYYFDQGFQIIVYLHKDTPRHHLHLLLNTVNFKTGKVFKQSLKALNRFKVHCNNILQNHNLDLIRMPTAEMLDLIPHDISEGFNICEIFDEVMADNAKVFEDLYDNSSSTYDENSSYDTCDFSMFSFYAPRSYRPYKAYTSPKPNKITKEVNSMDYFKKTQDLPATDTPQLPDTILNETGLTLNCSNNLNFIVPDGYSKEQLSDIINSVEPVSKEDKVFNAKLGIGSKAELQNRGLDTPVYVDTSTNINIIFDSVLESDIVDSPPKKK